MTSARIALFLALIAIASCKRKVDMTLPDSGAAITALPATSAAAAADAPSASAAADDAPLAPLAPAKSAPPVTVGATPKPHGSGATATTTPNGASPPECAAAKVMLANGRQKEFETLKASCVAKGGHL